MKNKTLIIENLAKLRRAIENGELKTEDIIEEILDYFANAISASEIAEKFLLDEEKTQEILGQAQREWDAIDVDPEGPTPEQDLALDLVIKRAVEALKEIKKESN